MPAIMILLAVLFETIPMKNIMSISTKQEDEHIIAVLGSGVIPTSLMERKGEREVRSINGKNSGNSKTNLVHQGFRIDEGILKLLADEASKKQISLSSLVNTILRNHTTHNLQIFEELGFIPIRKDFLRTIFNAVPKNGAEEVGKALGVSLANEYVSSFFPQLDSSTLIQFLELWIGRFQLSQHRTEETGVHNVIRHTFSVNHDINFNFSIALKVMLVGLIEPIIKAIVVFGDPTSSGIVFSFDI